MNVSLWPTTETGSTNIIGGSFHSLRNVTSVVIPMGMHETEGGSEKGKSGRELEEGDKEEGQDRKEKGIWRVIVGGERENGRSKKGGKGLTKRWEREAQERSRRGLRETD